MTSRQVHRMERAPKCLIGFPASIPRSRHL
jgi:hypothetical protein